MSKMLATAPTQKVSQRTRSKIPTVFFRARVDATRMKKAERVFNLLGLKVGDAVNLFFAQVALHNDLPFRVTAKPERLQSDEEQAVLWNKALGEY